MSLFPNIFRLLRTHCLYHLHNPAHLLLHPSQTPNQPTLTRSIYSSCSHSASSSPLLSLAPVLHGQARALSSRFPFQLMLVAERSTSSTRKSGKEHMKVRATNLLDSGLTAYHPLVISRGFDPVATDIALRNDTANLVKAGFNVYGNIHED